MTVEHQFPNRAGPAEASEPPSRPGWRWVCAASALAERGEGVRFELAASGGAAAGARPAFVLRHDGIVRAYLNQCAHVPVELDWMPGHFLDESGDYLICATHGAIYRPHDGFCEAGPCRGRSLRALVCEEHDGQVWVQEP